MEMRKIREHLSLCPSCQFELEIVHSIKLQTAGLADVEPPAGLESRLIANLDNRASVGKQGLAFGSALVVVGVAATLLAFRFSASTQVPPTHSLTEKEKSNFELASDSAYLGGSDPISGGVQTVAVGYAGGQ